MCFFNNSSSCGCNRQTKCVRCQPVRHDCGCEQNNSCNYCSCRCRQEHHNECSCCRRLMCAMIMRNVMNR